jgi:short-subunit dehydrogenase
MVRLDRGPVVVAHLHRDCAVGDRVALGLQLDPAGRGAMFARPEAPHEEDYPKLRAFTADPKFRNALIVSGRASTAGPLAEALFGAGASRVFVGVAETWKPHFAPSRAEIVPLDETDPTSVSDLAGRFGAEVDILINNADYFRPGGLIGSDASISRAAFETNCLGMMRLAAAFGPVMQARAAEAGRAAAAFVNIISVWCLSGPPEYGAYAATQAALRSLSHGLRAQLRPSGLRVMDVLTGPIDDEWRQTIRPPKVAPAALAAAVVAALREGREEVVVGEVAKEIHAKWAEDPRLLRQETL